MIRAEQSEREQIDLAGEWSYEPLARTEFREGAVLAEDTADLSHAGRMPVPSNWHRAGLPDFHGRVRFGRDLPEVAGDGWWLCFDGVDYLAEVVVDGTSLVRHEGAFDAFAVPLPRGARRLEVIVDAPREELGSLWPYRKRQIKGIFTQWEPMEPFQDSTGGIWAAVRLERRAAVHVERVATSTTLVPRPRLEEGQYVPEGATDARVLVEVVLRADAATHVDLAVQLCGAQRRRTLACPAGVSLHRVSLLVEDPRLWWPWDRGEPVLHELEVAAGEDLVRRRVGLREIALDEATGKLTVNGAEVKVRGSNVVPEKHLSLYDRTRIDADVALALRANLNALRVCVHVTRDEFYDACDEAGLLLWQDMPLQWEYLIDDTVIAEAADQCERVVQRLHDHASIALWSCHNEPFPVDRLHFAGAVVRAVRAADGSRPVHTHSDFSEHAYPGWFLGHVRDYANGPTAPMMTEFGAIGLPSAEEVRALGGTAWPPGGRPWDAVLHEPSPVLDVAGLPLTDDLETFVRASQAYQAVAVQRGIEAYRTKGVNFFHFLLMDGWPSITWSVVSYERVEKQAYAVLARACQQILVGSDLTRDVVSDAWDSRRFPPVVVVWVVNDTPDPLDAARWTARLGGVEVAGGEISVPALGVAHVTARGVGERWPSWTPPPLEPGEHQLELELTDASGAVRSRNAYPIRVVQRKLDLQPPA